MKKLVILLTILMLVGCIQKTQTNNKANDSVIEAVIKSYAYDSLSPEEAAHWDSMNADGGYMLVRGAERHLDTIVNHLHIISITEE